MKLVSSLMHFYRGENNDSSLSAYEQKRLDNIQKNQDVLKTLGLLDEAKKLIPRTPKSKRAKKVVTDPSLPNRRGARQRTPVDRLGIKASLSEDEDVSDDEKASSDDENVLSDNDYGSDDMSENGLLSDESDEEFDDVPSVESTDESITSKKKNRLTSKPRTKQYKKIMSRDKREKLDNEEYAQMAKYDCAQITLAYADIPDEITNGYELEGTLSKARNSSGYEQVKRYSSNGCYEVVNTEYKPKSAVPRALYFSDAKTAALVVAIMKADKINLVSAWNKLNTAFSPPEDFKFKTPLPGGEFYDMEIKSSARPKPKATSKLSSRLTSRKGLSAEELHAADFDTYNENAKQHCRNHVLAYASIPDEIKNNYKLETANNFAGFRNVYKYKNNGCFQLRLAGASSSGDDLQYFSDAETAALVYAIIQTDFGGDKTSFEQAWNKVSQYGQDLPLPETPVNSIPLPETPVIDAYFPLPEGAVDSLLFTPKTPPKSFIPFSTEVLEEVFFYDNAPMSYENMLPVLGEGL